MTTEPFFSIVMPVLNRRAAVCRAINSCLAQDFTAFEVLVVDDGSKDGTARAVAEFSDGRVRLILHQANRGVCPARNTAARASRGEWLIFLDSDHEMLPNCLSRIHQYVIRAGDSLDRFGFQYLFDDGRVSPSLLPPERIVRYAEWLRWIDRAQWTDALWVTRRRCFDHCHLPESFALEFSYFLDFAKVYTSRMLPLTLAFQHTDLPDRLSHMTIPTDPEMVKRVARDQAADWRYVLAEHGSALRRFAPRQYQVALRGSAIANLLAGNRGSALRASLAGLWLRPSSPYTWATFLLVLAGPGPTLFLNRIRSERRRRRDAAASRITLSNPSQSPINAWIVR